MHIFIAGGTGFIGTELTQHLLMQGHLVTLHTRFPERVTAKVNVVKGFDELNDDTKFDAVINLTGEPIANKRWSEQQKQLIHNSRIDTTNALIALFCRLKHRPSVFISGSAIGYYGISQGDSPVYEGSAGDTSFSSELCHHWESCAAQAEALGIRTCFMRTGIVLGKNGGALAKMLPPFKAGLGGKMGSGQHWMPWIHLIDVVRLITFCIENDALNGPVNVTSPTPVSNATFTEVLGKTLKRPTFATMPAFVVRLLFGQMGIELLLSGKQVIPQKALSHGFSFSYSRLDDALRHILSPH